jgi:hypothetical protein
MLILSIVNIVPRERGPAWWLWWLLQSLGPWERPPLGENRIRVLFRVSETLCLSFWALAHFALSRWQAGFVGVNGIWRWLICLYYCNFPPSLAQPQEPDNLGPSMPL